MGTKGGQGSGKNSNTSGGGGGKVRDYKVWSQEEEDALREGVARHGLGAWEVIRHNEKFKILRSRTGVQLKDKWRNLVKFKHVTSNDLGAIQAQTKAFYKNRRGRKPKPAANNNNNNTTIGEGEGGETSIPAQEGPSGSGKQGKSSKKTKKALEQQVLEATNPENKSSGNDDTNKSERRIMELQAQAGTSVVNTYQEAWPIVLEALEANRQSDCNGNNELASAPTTQHVNMNDVESGAPPTTTNPEEVVAHAADSLNGVEIGGVNSNAQKRPDRRKRSRGTTVKEDRRFGIYDERRYVPIHNDTEQRSGKRRRGSQSKNTNTNTQQQQEEDNELVGKSSRKTRGKKGEGDNQGGVDPQTVENDQNKLEAHRYPLKKNGFKTKKVANKESSSGGSEGSKEAQPGQSTPEQGANNQQNSEKWDMKNLPPKKAAALAERLKHEK